MNDKNIHIYSISNVAKAWDLGNIYHDPAKNKKFVLFDFIFTDFALKIENFITFCETNKNERLIFELYLRFCNRNLSFL